MTGPARLMETSHPRTPWCVVYTDPEKREKNGRAKRIPKWFKLKAEAVKHQAKLNKRLNLVGTVGLAMDAAARADFWAGRQILDAAGHLKVSFRELAERHVRGNPAAAKSRPLLEALDEFLAVKTEQEHASAETVKNLKVRLKAWWERDGLTVVAEMRRAAIKELRKRNTSATSKKNDMAAASSFCSWLVEMEELEANPVLGMKRPKVVRGRPPIWENSEAETLLRAARQHMKGKYLPAVVLMLANLRPSEVPHAKIIYSGQPCVKIEGDSGKMRGRANRVVPLWPAAVAWLKVVGKPVDGIPPITDMSRKTICKKEGLKWRADICRHTAISNRAAVLRDDARVAREAGTSETIIFSRYHRARMPAEARRFYRIKPG